MSYYFDQPRTPSFPIGLVKTESDFIIRSVETGWWRWTLVAAVISVDAYLFLAYGRWVHIEGHKNYFKDWCHMNSHPTFPIFTSFWLSGMVRSCKPDNFESQLFKT